jgi:acyl carrier protein
VTRERVTQSVLGLVTALAAELGYRGPTISTAASLLDDVGLTSIKFVDLTVGLEDLLQIEEFPMQRWIDEQAMLDEGARFTVGALVEECLRIVSSAGH